MKKHLLAILLVITLIAILPPTVLATGEEAEAAPPRLNLLNMDIDVTIMDEEGKEQSLNGLVTGLPVLYEVKGENEIQLNGLDWEALMNDPTGSSKTGEELEEDELILLARLLAALETDPLPIVFSDPENPFSVPLIQLSVSAPSVSGYTVTSLGENAFADIPLPYSFVLPETVTALGTNPFDRLLTEISVDEGNPSFFTCQNGILYSGTEQAPKELLVVPKGVTGAVNILPGTTSVAASACTFHYGVTSVRIPSSVQKIGDYAFDESPSIKTISFADDNKLTEIGNYAFHNTAITEITLPESLKAIGIEAFSGTQLSAITIPGNVTSIGDSAFSGSSLSTLEFQPGNLQAIGISAFSNSAITEVTIPASVETLGNSAFSGCASLATVTFAPGSRLTNIPDYLFSNGTAIDTISIPASVKTIGKEAFKGCSALKNVVFDNNSSLTSIGSAAFYGTTSLSSINLPDSLTSLGEEAFREASSLTSIVLPDGITEIANNTFKECYELKSVTFPSKLKTIGDRAFDIQTKGEIGQLTSLVLPDGLTTIGKYAFAEQSNITSIVFPASLETVGELAFSNVHLGPDLTVIFLGKTPPTTNSAFRHYQSYITYVPIGAKQAYYTEFTGDPGPATTNEIQDTLPTAIFDVNGGSGDIPSQVLLPDGILALPPCTFTKDGAIFDCWALDSAGTQPISGPTTTLTKDTTIYAIWYAPTPLSGYNGSDLSDATTYTYTEEADLTLTVVERQPNAVTCDYTWYSVASSEDLPNYATKGTELPNTTATLSIEDAAAGTYYRVCVVSATNAADATIEKVIPFSVTIEKATSTLTAPVAQTGLVYDGTAQALLSSNGSAIGGTLLYALTAGDVTEAPSTDWSEEPPTAISGGTYKVWYKVDGHGNYTDVEPAALSVTVNRILQTDPPASLEVESRSHNSVTLKAIVNHGNGAAAEYSRDGGSTWQTSNTFTGLTANTEYTFIARYKETESHMASDPTAALKVTTNQYTPPASSESGDSGGTGGTSGAVTPELPAPSVFTDIPADTYYSDAVAWAVENDITKGTSATTFSPYAPCTRAQVMTFLWRAAGSPKPSGKVNPFTDLSLGSYYSDAVLWAIENGITSGTGDGSTFSPDASCSRAQIVTFLWRTQKTPAYDATAVFSDVAANSYYGPAVQWAVENEITNGTGDGSTFSPNLNCTRSQIVTFLWRYFVD